jgi:hypothetical protein
MDYTDITKADLKAKLDEKGIKHTTKDTKEDLIAKLEAGRMENENKEEATPLNEPVVESEEAKSEVVVSDTNNTFKLAKNVKYKGVYREKGELVEIDSQDIEEFKNKELI